MSEFKTNKISPRKGTTQTIGDSGDTLSIASGVTVTNAGTISTAGISGGTINNSGGTISGLAGVVEWDTTAKTTGFTAVSNKGYFCNTTSAAFTVTLPASPTAGDVISLKDYANTFDTNNLTLNPNGNKIQGSTNNFIISVEGANSQFIYVDATRGWVLTDASKASDIVEQATFLVATGGTETTCGNYKIHTFTGPGTFCVSSLGNGPLNPTGGPNTVDYLVIAGGGGGGGAHFTPDSRGGGGGGAGGYRESHSAPVSGCYTASPLSTPTGITVTASPYPITVGGGGVGGRRYHGRQAATGSNSIFSTITSTGGGGAGGGQQSPGNGLPGGSGGGGSGGGSVGNSAGTGNTPPVSPSQGTNGGSGGGPGGGGGGGATVTGTSGSGGSGGTGATSSISTSPVQRSGGGGGGNGGSASGGGGAGGPPGVAGTFGTANTGGGGGGAGEGPQVPTAAIGGSGGSGIVIIRYKYQ